MAATVFVFVAGVGLGVWLGRRSMADPRVSAAAPPTPRPTPVAVASPPPAVALTDKARKKGLTEDSMRPSDDILERLRRAAEGDAAAIEETPAPVAESPPTPELTEAERRVLERLRQQQAADAE